METKLAFAKKLAGAALTIFALFVFLSLSAQAQKIRPTIRSAGPGAAVGQDCTTVGPNLVTNCGFETGDFTGWTLLDSGNMSVNTVLPNNGAYSAELGSVGTVGCISQTLTTTPNQEYFLSFALYNTGRPNNFQVFWAGGEMSGDMLKMPDFAYTLDFLGGGGELIGSGSDTLTFCAQNDPSFFYLDDIIVVPPLP